MKKILFSAAFSVLAFSSAPALAGTTIGDAEISANVGFVSDYAFRGISQSDESFAIQGGFDVSHTTGFYAGIWGSNVDFNDGDEASAEIDLYAGYSGSIEDISYDLGFIYYAYPGADDSLDYDFWEVSGSLGYDFGPFAASASVNYSPEYFGDSGDAVYLASDVSVPLSSNVNLIGHVGYQTIDDEAAFFGTTAPEESYIDWAVGVSYYVAGFDMSLQYVDTDLDEPTQCADGCDSRVIFGVSRSF